MLYTVYAYQHEVAKKHYSTWYFLATLAFGLYHWLLALRYFTSSREMPYIID